MPKGGKRLRKSDGLPGATKRSEEKIKIILEHIEDGLDQIDACIAAEIDYESWRLWHKKDPELDKRYKKAQIDAQRHRMKAIRDAETKDWKAAAWLLEKLYPLKFGSRAVLDVNTTVKHDYSKLTGEEKRSLHQLLMKAKLNDEE